MPSQHHTSVPCPHCGGKIRADANFCRHCGSSESDGWGGDDYDTDDDFDYEQFVQDNFSSSRVSHSLSPVWRGVAVILLLLFFGTVLLRLFG